MTRLLVSVRSAAEALAALAGGANLIDVKEPLHGSLGAATPQTWREIAAAVNAARPLSAALGELLEFTPPDASALQGYAFAKLGLAGCAKLPDWVDRWRVALATLPRGITPVAVAYADHVRASSPAPAEVSEVGLRLGCRAMLIDTFDKQSGSLFDVLSSGELSDLCQQARHLDCRVVLAGSLTLEQLDQALALWPDYVAVRGAVCRNSRSGDLDEGLVRRWADLLQTGL